MDIEFSASINKLARDHSKLRATANRRATETLKSKQASQIRRQQVEERRKALQLSQKKQNHVLSIYRNWERQLRVQSLFTTTTSGNNNGGRPSLLLLQPVSIYGEGDKITLPPSLLDSLLMKNYYNNDEQQYDGGGGGGEPMMFRVGILNDDSYEFPASHKLKKLKEEFTGDDDIMEEEEEEEMLFGSSDYYLDELKCKYKAYTYASVIEFTQEEGFVGIPQSIASKLIRDSSSSSLHNSIPVYRTIDPATGGGGGGDQLSTTEVKPETMDSIAKSSPEYEQPTHALENNNEKTPGHLAWNAFELPNVKLEISMVALPKGKGCKLVPTEDALRNGFALLKDVKSTLEQSLIRTRATISVGDKMSCWHRGVKFELSVESVSPPDFGAICCINTDVEVDIGAADDNNESATMQNDEPMHTEKEPKVSAVSRGGVRVLSGPESDQISQPNQVDERKTQIISTLLPEPPVCQKENICTVIIRGDGANARRRFDITVAMLKDLFAFGSSLISQSSSSTFQLVTRFPRKVIKLEDITATRPLIECGFSAGQELFMIEKL